jgi:hypothetical protein
MTKKVIALMAIMTVCGATLFAQETAPKKGNTAFSVDIVPLVRSELVVEDEAGIGAGLNFEKLIGGNLSIGGRLEFVVVDKMTFIELDAHGRWYPLGASLEKLFLDGGLGYGRYSFDGTTLVDGLTISLKAGWKHALSPKLFVEPVMGYTLAKPTVGFGPTGLGIGISLGAIF